MTFFNSRTAAKLEALDRSQAVIEFLPDGTIVAANENFLKTVGYDLAEIKGQHHRIFVDGTDRDSPAYKAFWAALAGGEFQRAEYRRIGKGGREIWLQATYNPIRGRDGRVTGVVKFATDITEEKRRSADTLSQIEAIDRSQGVIEFDLDGTILSANRNFLDVVGYSLEEVRGQHHRLFVDGPERDSAAYRVFWEGLAKGVFQSGEFRRVGKDGRAIWLQATYNPILDPAGRPIKVVKFATDITAERLRTAELQGQVEAIGRSQGVIHFDLAGHVLDANPNFLAVLGYDLAQIRGQHHRMFVEPGYGASAEYGAFWTALRRGEFQSGIFQRVGAGGRIVWIQASYNPILDMSGTPFKVVKYATDITARMRSQIEAARAGEAGRGFAVVAGEVKNLSNQVTNATARIAEDIKTMQTVSGDVVTSLTAIGQAIDVVRGFVTGVASAVEEQSAVTQEISMSMQTAAHGVAQIDRNLQALAS
ncbi:MAG: PAS domain S-box protein [Alphaproteobacteria bacterium]|nr:MAG: PAS domain S-box protein [Alphaproteobacteria bacterium]